MKRERLFLFGLAFSVLGTFLSSVISAAEPRFVRLTRDDGLSDNTVEAIVEDRRGFLWFATADGLNRWDGGKIATYRHDPDDPESLSHSFVFSLLVDREGNLWIGTANGLNRYRPRTDSFQRFMEDGRPSSIKTSTIYTLSEPASEDLWIGGYQGLSLYQRAQDRFVDVPLEPETPETGLEFPRIQAVLEDQRGDLWVGTAADGLYRRDRGAENFRNYRSSENPLGLAHDEVKDLLEDRRGRVWIATTGGLQRYDPARDAFITYRHDPKDPGSLSDDHLDVLMQDRDGTLWIGTVGSGISRMDLDAEGRFTHLRTRIADPFSLGGDVVREIYEDRRGDLWIGIYTGGVSFFNRDTQAFDFFRHEPDDPRSLSNSSVNAFLEEDEFLWVGTENGLNRLDLKARTATRYLHDENDPTSLSAPPVLSILRDSLDDVWVGTYLGGVNRLDSSTGRFERFQPDPNDPNSLSNPNVFGLFEDRRGRVWLGTFGGANRFERSTNSFRRYPYIADDPTSVGNDIVWNFFEDSAGTLWLATPGGLSRYVEEEDAFRTYGPELGLPTTLTSMGILSIAEDSAGRFWVGTEGGLQLFDRETGDAVAFDLADGLPSRIILGILPDDDGMLWLSTNDGVSRFDPETREIANFAVADGVRAAPFKRNAYSPRRDGRLLVGGTAGFTLFDPDAVRTNSHHPSVVLTDFRIFNQAVPFGAPGDPLETHVTEAERIVLQPDQSVFSLSFAALNYRNPSRNQYAYRLDGFQDEWIASEADRTATFTNLDPGTYVFRARGTNNSGLWSEQDATVEIVVLPEFWETWWFRITGLSGICGLLAIAYRLRTTAIRRRSSVLEHEIAERKLVEAEREKLIGELEAKNEELERFSATVSHDLQAPLVTILGFSGMIARDASAGELDRVRQDTDKIQAAAKSMQTLLEELLALSRAGHRIRTPQPIALSALVRDVAEHIAGAIDRRGVRVDIQEEMPRVLADPLRMSEVFQNLMSNAVSYFGDQHEPRLEIAARTDGDSVLCTVRDNGIGIDPSDLERVFGLFERLETGTEGTGLGLAITRRIVEAHGGEVWVESEGPGRGSTFFLKLPPAP